MFGAIHWSGLDAVITVGDPRRNVEQVKDESLALGLDAIAAAARHTHLATDELAQAHGRLRPPRRERGGLSLHYGSLIPGGWTSDNASIHWMKGGRPSLPSSMTPAEFTLLVGRAGSVRKLGVMTGIPASTLRTYANGRAVPLEQAQKLRAVLVATTAVQTIVTAPVDGAGQPPGPALVHCRALSVGPLLAKTAPVKDVSENVRRGSRK